MTRIRPPVPATVHSVRKVWGRSSQTSVSGPRCACAMGPPGPDAPSRTSRSARTPSMPAATGQAQGNRESQDSSGTMNAGTMGSIVASVVYREGRNAGNVDIDDVAKVLTDSDGFVWIGLHEPTQDVLRHLQRAFGLYYLA